MSPHTISTPKTAAQMPKSMDSTACLSDMRAVRLVLKMMLPQCPEDAHISSTLQQGMKLACPVMVWSMFACHQVVTAAASPLTMTCCTILAHVPLMARCQASAYRLNSHLTLWTLHAICLLCHIFAMQCISCISADGPCLHQQLQLSHACVVCPAFALSF